MFLLVADIKGLFFKFDRHRHPSHTLHDAKREFYHYFEKGQNKNTEYPEAVNNKVSVIESYGGAMGNYPVIINEELARAAKRTGAEKQSVAESAKSKYLGVAMMWGADQGRYGKLMEELQNKFTNGNEDSPSDKME